MNWRKRFTVCYQIYICEFQELFYNIFKSLNEGIVMQRNVCNICPRECKVDRSKSMGLCGTLNKLRVSKVGLHMWEEPCISHKNGSGTIFFSGCNLKCVFCQNFQISAGLKGRDITPEILSNEILKLQEMGADNINLVTPTHFADLVIVALAKIKNELYIPVCYNCGGYEKVETIEKLSPFIDIFMPDIKFFDSAVSYKYAHAHDYFVVASRALEKMYDLKGYAQYDDNVKMVKGVLTRHLVLPTLYKDSISIIEYLASNYDSSKFALSLMSQYFPTANCTNYPEINRKLTTLEYMKVVDKAKELGFTNCYTQEKTSADESYVPNFDY